MALPQRGSSRPTRALPGGPGFGLGPAGAKAALDTLPPLVLVGVRGVVAGAVLVAWALASGPRWPTRRQWLAAFVIGVLILALGAGAAPWASAPSPPASRA